MSTLPSTPPQSKSGSGCLPMIGLFVLMAFIVGGCSALFGNDKDSKDLEYGAWDVCQQEVDTRLKAPATAGYPLLSEISVVKSGDTYTLNAWVDAENGFGANVRTYFTCVATHTSGENYTVRVSVK